MWSDLVIGSRTKSFNATSSTSLGERYHSSEDGRINFLSKKSLEASIDFAPVSKTDNQD
jgi:hypothetical protein